MDNTMQKIRDIYPELSSAKKSAASFFLNNFQSIPFMNVTELAAATGVSDTTIINLCADLGFSGFSGFKKAVCNEVRREQNAVLDNVGESVSDDGFLDGFGAAVTENIRQTFADEQNKNAFQKTVELIHSAKKTYFIGFWSFAAHAQETALQLRRFGYSAEAIFPSYGDYIDKVLQIKSDEVVVLFDFARYISGLTEICIILREKGVPVVLITDMGPCPRHAYASEVIHCRTVTPYGTVGGITAKAVLDAMRKMLVLKYPNVGMEYDKVREGIFTRFNQYGVVEPGSSYTERV